MPERFRAIARVQKTHGRTGEVVTVPVHGLPCLIHEGLEVAVVPPALKGTRWHTVTSCFEDSRAGQLVSLSGVDSIGDADPLVGKTILARVSDLPQDLSLHDPENLVGRVLVSEKYGELGRITEVMVVPANDVWVAEGPYGEVLLPVIDEVVSEVPEEGPIQVRVPGGIIGGA